MTPKEIFFQTPAYWLYDVQPDEEGTAISIIAGKVSEFYGIPIDKMKMKTRKRPVVKARQTVMYLARACTKRSLKSIGYYFNGKDHTTVIHACQTVKDLMDTEPNYKIEVLRLKAMIN